MACENKMHDFSSYTLPFAAWELRLYLNSHPHDRSALWLYEELMKKTCGVNYASVDLTAAAASCDEKGSVLNWMDQAACAGSGNLDQLLQRSCECQEGDFCPYSWAWIEGPWPWEGCCSHCAE